ncbi:hypothetical protein H3H36_15610 [Duganella sp. FT3S]|uniref:Uncharacterized protein n=1 Tax=Rugamonas fusca TaxID=2758568 RepID=A0A7W2I7X9_9BURK|nr:hypothetical protein [Rugamonas fusca]MBA5606783.1 hypothetical protein [Rugamonas fusca]
MALDHIDIDISVAKRRELGRPVHVMQTGQKLKQLAVVFLIESDWRNVVVTLGYADILVLGFEIPTGKEGAAAADAARCLRQAQDDLLRGKYDAVVSQCRLAVEGISIGSAEASAASVSVAKYTNGKERKLMTKSERALFIGEAIRHFTHLAHHPNPDGTQETFNRAEAQAILACTVAFVDGALSRARSKID